MIKTNFLSLYGYLLDHLYINRNHNAYIPLHYINTHNIIVYRTLKCAQTSVDQTLHRFAIEGKDLSITDQPNTFVGFVRDPYHRAKSIIDMSLYNIQCFYSVKVGYRDFMDLTHCTDEHFLPQICFIPVRKSLNIAKRLEGRINVFEPRRFDLSWSNVADVDMLDVLASSEDTYKFIRMHEHRDAVVDLYKYCGLGLDNLDISSTRLNVGASRYKNIEPERLVNLDDPDFINYVDKVYHQDIKFYNNVKCVND